MKLSLFIISLLMVPCVLTSCKDGKDGEAVAVDAVSTEYRILEQLSTNDNEKNAFRNGYEVKLKN